LKKIVLKLIHFYQNTRFLFLSNQVCRFEPTCSQYTYQAVEKYGTIKGLFLGLKRIIRCHPWSKGGFDPVK